MDQFTADSTPRMSNRMLNSLNAKSFYTDYFTRLITGQHFPPSLSRLDETSSVEDTAVPTSSNVYEQENTIPGTTDEGRLPHSRAQTPGELHGHEPPLDDLLDEDMTLLFDTTEAGIQERNMPPSSITELWDHDSRSAREFDPSLQYSSPRSSSERCNIISAEGNEGNGKGGPTGEGEDLLDEEVDWNTVYVMTSTMPKVTSIIGSPEPKQRSQTAPGTTLNQSSGCSYAVDDSMSLRPFPPNTIPRGLSKLPALTRNMLLRTCFRIGEMLSHTVRCHKLQQGVIFELFARVTYSNRERITKKQHFQFIDLEKDQQPYPSGMLTGWETGSNLDHQSLAFANTRAYPKLCWCLCQPKRDPKAAIGWTYTIISIKETSWRQVCLAKTVLLGSDSELSKGALMSRL
ncbi:hypothetical protein MGN70_001158 [Eutypa lata]|nr:hypothetical protein MGN70_001158 [Eutypa lata]